MKFCIDYTPCMPIPTGSIYNQLWRTGDPCFALILPALFFARKQLSIHKFRSGNTPLKYALVEKSANRKALHPQDYRLTGFLSTKALALASALGYQVW
jgi:hypothetical protein